MRLNGLILFVITNTIGNMSKAFKPATKPRRAGALEEQVFINLMLTVDVLSRRLEPVLKAAEISPTQYNVLRILRGSPDGLACGEIGDLMIGRDPDITRLLDRMEKRGLVSRCREVKDRRMVMTRITEAGLKLLSQLDGPVLDAHHLLLGHLGSEKLKTLLALLQHARSPQR
jgi:DNA-binding MarR family transcriptional regulator